MKKIILSLITVITLTSFINYHSSAKPFVLKHTSDTTSWYYHSEVDKMTSKIQYFALLESSNKLNFQFPYNGGSKASIDIITDDSGPSVLLSVDKGQFLCNDPGCEIDIRFDDNKAMSFKAQASSSGSINTLFISPEKKFIAQLKKSHHMIIGGPFYQEGIVYIEFNTAGFIWNH